MVECWSENPKDRPTFSQLKSKFDKMLLQSNHYIQFSCYATVGDNPPGYDHLPPPAVPVPFDTEKHNGASQSTSHNKAKQSAVKTLSAPLVDADNQAGNTNVAAILRSSSNVVGVSAMLRVAPSNPYVQTPLSTVNPRFQAGGADVKVNSGNRKRDRSRDSAKRVIGERKRRVNTETRRTAHLKVAGTNAVQFTVPAEPYDRLEMLEGQTDHTRIHSDNLHPSTRI